MNQEGVRHGCRGYVDGGFCPLKEEVPLVQLFDTGLLAGALIGLPAILNFGSPEMQQRIVPAVFNGKEFLCLAISEAFAGSDVADIVPHLQWFHITEIEIGIKTTAKKTADGKHWIINGTKRWITNGAFFDYFVVACKSNVIDLFLLCLIKAQF